MKIDTDTIIELGKLSQIEACIQYPDLARKLDASGIYAIRLCNHVVYVGQAHTLFFRLVTHCQNLQAKKLRKREDNIKYRYLKNHLNNITFEILEFTRNIDVREKYYMQKYDPIFNISMPGGYRYFNGTDDDINDFVYGLLSIKDLHNMLGKKQK